MKARRRDSFVSYREVPIMLRNLSFLAVLVSFSLTGLAQAQELPEGLKCFVGGKDADAKVAVEYRGANVYLCCEECAKAFSSDTSKYAVQANQQLVLTGQFEQTKCPIAGKDFDESETAEVDGIKVFLCCENCTAKVAAVGKEGAAELVFADEVFEKSFAAKTKWDLADIKCFMMPKRDVKESKAVDHHDGKVFFCCPNCVKKWNKAPEKYVTQGNLQLVQTGQYEQTKCPISGGDLDDEQVAEVDGVTVKFCCGNCQGKVASASTEEAKRELVFGEKRFAKGFEKK